jgi:diguanylate cyclase (GGDEF)-like protein/PAS domain S-box-containing protein
MKGDAMPETRSDKLYKDIVQTSSAAICITDPQGRFLLVNKAWCKLTGYSEAEAKHLTLKEISLPLETKKRVSDFDKIIKARIDSYQKLICIRCKDGSFFWASKSASALTKKDGAVTEVLIILQDIDSLMKTEDTLKHINQALEAVNDRLTKANQEIQKKNKQLQAVRKQLVELARTDSLTGLPNRRQLEESLLKESHRTNRSLREFSICIGDIDDFKNVNDNYGHDIGDQVLRDVAGIFKESTRSTDVIGRWGGEEFLFMLPETPVDGAMTLMERIRQFVQNHVTRLGDVSLSVTMTFGCSAYLPGNDLDQVIKQADLALYAGKKDPNKNLAVKFEKHLEIIHSIHN